MKKNCGICKSNLNINLILDTDKEIKVLCSYIFKETLLFRDIYQNICGLNFDIWDLLQGDPEGRAVIMKQD